jgi:hypothetical protein
MTSVYVNVGVDVDLWRFLSDLSQPHFEGMWGWHSHSQNGDLGVF